MGKVAQVMNTQSLLAILAGQGRKHRWLASQLGVHESSVSRWVYGAKCVPLRRRAEIAGFLGVSPDGIDWNDAYWDALREERWKELQRRKTAARLLQAEGYQLDHAAGNIDPSSSGASRRSVSRRRAGRHGNP